MKTRLIGLVVMVALVSGCASTRIFPKQDGTYLMLANSSSESAANDAALEKGQEYCLSMGKQFVLVSMGSQYQGMDKNAKAVVGVVSGILGSGRRSYSPGYDGSSHDDYKVEVTFRCK